MTNSEKTVADWESHQLHKQDMLPIIKRFGVTAVVDAMATLASNNPQLITAHLCAGGHCPEA